MARRPERSEGSQTWFEFADNEILRTTVLRMTGLDNRKGNIMKHEINRHDILEKITPLIENTAMRFGYIPIEIEFIKENHRWFLRIYLYSKEKDVTLDDCENVTRSLSDFLDELIPVKYYLEVSSPGLERKFKSDKEFTYFNGRRISLKLKQPLEGEEEKIFKGEILDFNETDGLKFFRFDDGQELQIPRENIQSAKLYID
jgi:ribosome maturation factor RimP